PLEPVALELASPPVARLERRDRGTVGLLLASVLLAAASIAMVAGVRSDASAEVAVAPSPPPVAAPAAAAEPPDQGDVEASASSTEEARPVASSEAPDAPPPPVVAPKRIVKASSRSTRTPPARAVLPKPPSLMPRKAPPNP